MKEYTYADVIIDPNDKRVKIGEKYYMGGTPNGVLEIANKANELFTDILIDIDDKDDFPFIGGSIPGYYCCLIKPREPKVKYTPFDLNNKEDRNYLRNKWIRRKEGDSESPIISFDLYNGNWYTGGNSGKELLENFTFLDGTPIGKRMEE